MRDFAELSEPLRAVERYKGEIARASVLSGVPGAMIEAVLMREQEMIDLADDFADQAVEWKLRGDSSTGVMQVFGRTAIRSINEAARAGLVSLGALGFLEGAPLDAEREEDLDAVWKRLHDEPDFCILAGALTLLSCARETVSSADFAHFGPEELKKTFARYNGRGEDALRYGEECLRRYEAFKQLAHDDEFVDRE